LKEGCRRIFVYVKDSVSYLENLIVVGRGKISVGHHERAPARRAVVLAAMNCDHHRILIYLGRGKPSGKPGKGRTRRK
jgi:hypothetical protein